MYLSQAFEAKLLVSYKRALSSNSETRMISQSQLTSLKSRLFFSFMKNALIASGRL